VLASSRLVCDIFQRHFRKIALTPVAEDDGLFQVVPHREISDVKRSVRQPIDQHDASDVH